MCHLRAWESADYSARVLKRAKPLGAIPVEKINVVGSSMAMGHPFAATGARITGTLAKLLSQKPGSRGLISISICTAGGWALRQYSKPYKHKKGAGDRRSSAPETTLINS
ncbi:MAG: hypothetical protein H7249_00900 [Chitinophagaceae bacterium]|nr:hypothetical protein [Oligoflexus sp.]